MCHRAADGQGEPSNCRRYGGRKMGERILIATGSRMIGGAFPSFFRKHLPEAEIVVAEDVGRTVSAVAGSHLDLVMIDEFLARSRINGLKVVNGCDQGSDVTLIHHVCWLLSGPRSRRTKIAVTVESSVLSNRTSREYLMLLSLSQY